MGRVSKPWSRFWYWHSRVDKLGSDLTCMYRFGQRLDYVGFELIKSDTSVETTETSYVANVQNQLRRYVYGYNGREIQLSVRTTSAAART